MTFGRRIQVLQVDPTILFDVLKGKHPAFDVTNPIPEDATMVKYQEDKFTGTINVYLYSDAFPEVPLGMIPPYMQTQWVTDKEVRTYVVYRCMEEPLEHTFATFQAPGHRPSPNEDEASCPWCDSHCTIAHRLTFWLKEQLSA